MPLDKEINKLINQRITDSRNRAKKNGWEHDIDAEYVRFLLVQSGKRCPYSGEKFVFEKGHPNMFSLDRVDSSKGYTKDNVVVTSVWANKAKNDLPLEKFLEFCKNVTEVL